LERQAGDHATTSTNTASTIPHCPAEIPAELFDNWFDRIEAAVRDRVREFIQATIEEELEATLGRRRYRRQPKDDAGTSFRHLIVLNSKGK
jgi:hypothetical protein